MSLIKKLLLISAVVLGLILGVWFSVENSAPLSVVLLGMPMPALSSGIWITGALLLGAGLGYLVSWFATLPLKNENLSLKRKIKRRDKELERLRKAPLSAGGSVQE
ncbi:DUF1049 domain-containing protein [Pseudomaricurvus alkylphenolicus]|uniref:lipopolysaccharide assembly protein LapA domain-containing protein n=1 Tax=Pseudomaricurvus alkylphenolicus TaxID=1306991 RepID=UPI00142296AC|nr:lipopolysaccharide assembly protein LapA domain-containing protein [Pseudomaricurvus alkylphenolicus]NIB42074.1 DUF1049 domain-containing protein [Pseudomaricurvus alkylphenolicus]